MLGAFGSGKGGKDRLEGLALEDRLGWVDGTTFPRIEAESVSGGFGVLPVLEPGGSVELDLPAGLEEGLGTTTGTPPLFPTPLAAMASAVVAAGATTGALGSPSRSITSSSGPSCTVIRLDTWTVLNEKKEVHEALFSTESLDIGFWSDIAEVNSAIRDGSSGMVVEALGVG